MSNVAEFIARIDAEFEMKPRMSIDWDTIMKTIKWWTSIHQSQNIWS